VAEALAAALGTPGLWALVLTITIAGIVRGFTGFGTALIFVPVAGRFLSPADVITVMTLTGVASTAALVPRALGQGEKREVGLLVAGALVTVPLGLWAMTLLPQEAVRWTVSAIAAVTLAALVTGWRYDATLGVAGLLAVGLGAGLMGGLTGLTGPVVILFYLAGRKRAQVVRANTILFLAALDVVIVVSLFLGGLARTEILWLALLLAVPYFVTALIGQRLFDPAREAVYRWGAYCVIAGALLRGLPIWN